jgi:hypothetical protein
VASCIAVLWTPLDGQTPSQRSTVRQVATINASVRVVEAVGAPAQASGVSWGAVVDGAVVSVDPRTSPRAATLQIRAPDASDLALSLELPTELSRAGGGPGIPVDFGAESACWVRGSLAGCMAFDPNPTDASPFPISDPGTLRLGGTVRADAVTAPGDYSAVVTATIQYTSS